ncbi:MAG: gliding motility-associated C-terminal domain-containing protein [Bacteroidota bacterium]
MSGQETYQRYIDVPDSLILLNSIEVLDGKVIVLGEIGQKSYANGLSIISLNRDGTVHWVKQYSFDFFFIVECHTLVDSHGDLLVLMYVLLFDNPLRPEGQINAQRLVKFNREGELLWDRLFDFSSAVNGIPSYLSQTEDDTYLVSLTNGFVKLSSTGQVLEQRVVQPQQGTFGGNTIGLMDGDILMLSASRQLQGIEGRYTVLTKLDSTGNLLWSKGLSDFIPWHIYLFPNGDWLLSGYRFTEFEQQKFIRLSPEGEIIWKKHLPIRNDFKERNTVILEDGSIVTYLNQVDTTILVKLDGQGNVIWANRYSKNQPNYIIEWGNVLRKTPDNGFAMLNRRFQLDEKDIIIKTDKFGRINDCYTARVCVETSDFELLPAFDVSTNVQVVTERELQVIPISGVVKSISNATSIDYCPKLAVPSPYFTLPDTICENTSITPDALCQAQADTWRWEIEGQNQSSVAQPQDLTFPNIGTQQLVHIIETDGCLDTFARRVEVVAAPAFDIGQDTVLCEDAPFVWNVEQSNLQNYRWSDSLTGAARTITEGGFYTVSAEGEHCTVRASRDMAFISMLYSENPIRLGEDTTICQQLPLELEAAHPAAARYIWEDGSIDSKRDIIQTGNYGVTATIAGCPFEAEINVLSEDCTARVYVPTVFSPNGDGQNDVFEMSVGDALIEQIQIYDRWGNLVHTGTPTWDGTVRGQQANAGTYIYQVEYLEVRLGTRKVLEGEVLLMR